MTRFVNKGHIARAALEAAAFQSRDVIDAAIGIAKAELSSANVGVALQFSTQSQALDVRDMTALLGDLGTQSAARLSSGTISLSQDDLKAYDSPWEGA